MGDTELKNYRTNCYKNLFGQPEENHMSMVESRIDDISQVTEVESEILISAFSETHVMDTVFHIEHYKAYLQSPEILPSFS